MNITPINSSCNFGKTPIFHCTVKKAGSNEKEAATLYLTDKNNSQDVMDIKKSNLPVRLRLNFTDTRRANSANFYCLQTDEGNEIVSAAQTTRHLNRHEGKYEGINTIIDEFGANDDFVDPLTPLLAHIVKTAQDKGDKFVLTAFRAEEAPSFKNASFSETKYENWAIPERRYTGLIDKAEKRAQIEYLI